MMRSLYSGVSGMINHQIRMDVVGNNVSNVNTIGFKKGRVNFQDLVSQMISGAAKPNEEVGGVNPKQVGLGMLVATIDTIHTQGSLQVTAKKTDCAVNGDGFFILKAGDNTLYTRAGAFEIDKDGTLVNPANGMRVQGWSPETINGETRINKSNQIGDLQIPIYGKEIPKATEFVTYKCNLDQRTLPPPQGQAHTTTIDVFDSLGNTHQLRLEFTKIPETTNEWQVQTYIDNLSPLARVRPEEEGAAVARAGTEEDELDTFRIQFDTQGRIISAIDANGQTVDAGMLNMNLLLDIPGANQLNFDLRLGNSGMFDGITQEAKTTTTKAREQDGYSLGYLEDFEIDQNGIITGVYSNGQRRDLGQLALATFTNPSGLEKAGETNFVVSNNSGAAIVGASNTEGKGTIHSGSLEMSNVDLTETFVDMIVTQRGFQANSRSITTSDQMLQEVLSLKR
ncbi:MAG: flagellar hook protein FlgE [Spirochaetales bacterium]|nr:flagellar hook protein FlgE [Spirochaetales bacterium]